MNEFLTFRKMITPVIIQVLFWIGVVACVIAAIANILKAGADRGQNLLRNPDHPVPDQRQPDRDQAKHGAAGAIASDQADRCDRSEKLPQPTNRAGLTRHNRARADRRAEPALLPT